MKKTYVIYNKDSIDGYVARYIAWRNYKETATYYGLYSNEPIVDYFFHQKDCLIVFIGINIDQETLKRLKEQQIKCQFIGSFSITSISNKAWKFFNPDRPLPKAIVAIDDYFSNQYIFPDSRSFVAGIEANSRELDYMFWNGLCDENSLSEQHFFRETINDGNIYLAFKARVIERQCIQMLQEIKFAYYENLNIALIPSTLFNVELSNYLFDHEKRRVEFILMYQILNTGVFSISIEKSKESKLSLPSFSFNALERIRHSPTRIEYRLTLKDGLNFIEGIYTKI